MHPTKKAGRIAGAIYASMVFVGPFSLIYVPNKLIVRGDATATAANVLAHQTLFGFGIMADMAGAVIFISLAVALYRLLSGISVPWALLMVGFAFVSAAVGFVDTLNNIAALHLFRGGEFSQCYRSNSAQLVRHVLSPPAQSGHLHERGLLGSVALSVWPSRLSLRIFTALDRSLAHDQLFRLHDSQSHRFVLSGLLRQLRLNWAQPVLFGELAIMLWLLIKGAKVPTAPSSALQPAAA